MIVSGSPIDAFLRYLPTVCLLFHAVMSSTSASSRGALVKEKGPGKPKKPYPLYLGGVAASIAAVATHPLDVAKVRMQTSKDHSMLRVLSKSVKTDGIVKGAYAGLSASLLRQMTYSLVRFSVYDSVKNHFEKTGGGGPVPVYKLAIAGSIAGAAGGLAGNPADIVLVRMISDVNRAPAEQLKYKHGVDGLVQITKQEGFSSLFRGLTPNVTRAVLMNASQLASYDFFKRGLLKTGYMRDNMLTHFTSSILAGAVATTVCSPSDVLKSRIMNSSANLTIMQVVKQSFAQEGIRWAFRGWLPAFTRLAPNSIVIFVTLEQLRILVDTIRAKSA